MASGESAGQARAHFGSRSLPLIFLSSLLYLFLFNTAASAIINMASLHLSNKEQTAFQLREASGTYPPSTEVFDNDISHVHEKYRGTAADARDMSALGKKQVLRVRIPSEIAALQMLIVSSETSVFSPCSASHRHVLPVGKVFLRPLPSPWPLLPTH